MTSHEHPAADVSVRVGWADDAAGIAAVQVRAWREEYVDLLPAEVLDALDPDQFAAAWQASLTSPQDARNRVLVALERNTVRGFAVTGPATDPDGDPVADGEISELTVDPDQTRHGHGSRLVQACADTLRADRFRTALVWLNADGRRTTGVPDRGRLGARRRPPRARPARRRLRPGQAGPPAHRPQRPHRRHRRHRA